MGYLADFQQRISRDDYQGFVHLWEEYVASETVDGQELEALLREIRESRFGGRFGAYVETALPLWEQLADAEESHAVLREIIDLQTTNSPELAELTFQTLHNRYGEEEFFNEKIRLVGLRNGDEFQGAIRNYELLSHLKPGNYVYHTGGWGTGEVMEASLVREEIVLEFEAVPGRKPLPFENAFATLVAIEKDHFLARRFGDPDQLEAEARKDPVAIVRMLLQDLGPRTAAEIKEEMIELVIPADDWTRWWQSARSRVKKDTRIATPSALRDPFSIREEEVSHADRITEVLKHKHDADDILSTTYNFVRDFAEILRKDESREFVKGRLVELLGRDDLTEAQRLQATAILEEHLGETLEPSLDELVAKSTELPTAIDQIGIGAVKKLVLIRARSEREDWGPLFLEMLFTLPQSALREFMAKELTADEEMRSRLLERLDEVLEVPIRSAHFYVWAFQRVMNGSDEIPLAQTSDTYRWFESFLVLFHQLEHVPEYRDLVKKMFNLLTGKRYAMVREQLKESSLEFAREFLLLVTKCHTLDAHDQQIMRSLAEVVHPSLAKEKGKAEEEEDTTIWTTDAGYQKVQSRIEEIGTVETVDNAREIESARALGDLRENAEFKAALERRSRLQGELRMLSDQLNRARILTREDVSPDTIGTGSVVELHISNGETIRYTLLGPWDAEPENQILSYQSKLAQAMTGLHKGDTFDYQDKQYTVESIESYFDLQGAAK